MSLPVDRAQIEHAAELIRQGKLVAFPTETVYGLGANALDVDAVARIFAAKRRPRTSPLIVHVDGIEMAAQYVSAWPESAQMLAAKYWPGPLTLVLPKRSAIPDIVTAGLPTVALRIPAHPIAIELIRAAGVPIAAPSANRFTELSPTQIRHVPEALADFTIDGGPARIGIESTVLSLVGEPRLLRPGVIALPDLEAIIGPIAAPPAGAEGAHASPGMHARHYRPRTPLLLLHPAEPSPKGNGARLRINHEMPADPRAYAAALYGKLHELDAAGLDWIAVDRPPQTPEWAGVIDRLTRAAN